VLFFNNLLERPDGGKLTEGENVKNQRSVVANQPSPEVTWLRESWRGYGVGFVFLLMLLAFSQFEYIAGWLGPILRSFFSSFFS
jgi:hypothetical protein